MKGTVLIVDDNEENLYMLRALLQGHGYQVVEARNGEEALAKARSSPPTLAISDILMPVMDGFTLCREWKKDEVLKEKPFIFYTATYTDPKDEEFALSLGAERFIIKPADPEEFMRSIEEVIEAAEEGKIELRRLPPQDEACVLKRYNQRLIQKLEKKMQDLQREAELRRRSEQRLSMLVNLFLRLSTDYRSNIESIVSMGRQVMDVPLAVYMRLDRKGAELLTRGAKEGTWRPGGTEGRFLERLLWEVENQVVLSPLPGLPDVGEDPLIMGSGLQSLLGCPVKLEGEKKGFLAFLRTEAGDWSEDMKNIARMLARALEIEEERLAREEGMKDFIDVASHEIRHPVTVIMGYSQTLKDLWERLDRGSMEQMLESIWKGAERLEKLSRRLLHVSSIQRGTFLIRREETDLGAFFHDWFELEARLLGDRLRISSPTELGTACIDPVRLEELLSILVDNAVKFSPPASPIEVEVVRDGNWLEVEVKDRGYGVPKEIESRLFECFVQGEDTLHHSLSGIGVGLYIAMEIVRRHGGKLWYEPREGGGSVFRFVLPVE